MEGRENGMTVSHALALWLEEIEHLVDPATHYRYEESARLYIVPTVGDVPLADFGRRQIKGLLLSALRETRPDGTPRFSKSTVRVRIFGVVRTFLSWAVDEELVPFHPALELGRKLFRRGKEDPTPRGRSMTPESMARWLGAVEKLKPRTRLGLFVMLDGGLRLSEMLGLKESDFDLDNGVLHVRRQVRYTPRGEVLSPPKSRAGVRDVALSARVRETFLEAQAHRWRAALRAGRGRIRWTAWDFSTQPLKNEASCARVHYERAMRSTCAAAGIERYTPHSLRHTFGTILADEGEGLKALKSLMGHSNLAQTEEYVNGARPRGTVPVDRIATVADRLRRRV